MVEQYKIRAAQAKMMRGLLDLAVLQLIQENGKLHGYGVVTAFRDIFGMYFGPSTIYPLLSEMEKEGYVKSSWDLNRQRPRKDFILTPDGKGLLDGSQESFNHIARKMVRSPTNLSKTPEGQGLGSMSAYTEH
jgi:DNA-binding PadR family transcriptional regulator